jgi:hypothetical protein
MELPIDVLVLFPSGTVGADMDSGLVVAAAAAAERNLRE